MACKKLKLFLDEQHVKYLTLQHSRAYTAQEIAESAHVSGNNFAKVVMLKADAEMVMGVLPASDKVDLKLLSKTLDEATGLLLENRKSPSRKSGELDNRGSHYYLAAYWAKALAEQNEDIELKERFSVAARQLAEKETAIVKELNSLQGAPADIGGYYKPQKSKTDTVMRPCKVLNNIVDSI